VPTPVPDGAPIYRQADFRRVLLCIVFLGLCFTPLLPFVVDYRMAYPFVTGRNFAFRALVEVLGLMYVLLAVSDARYRPSRSSLFIIMTLLTIWMGVAVLLSQDPTRSFWSLFERMGGYITLLHLFAFFVIASSVAENVLAWQRLWTASVIASAMMGVYVAFDFIAHSLYGRAAGTFGNAMYLGLYMLFNLFFTLFIFVSEMKFASRAVWRKGMLIALAALIALGSLFLVAYASEIIRPVFVPGTVMLIGICGLLCACLRERAFFLAFLVIAFTLQGGSLILTQTRGSILATILGLTITAVSWFVTGQERVISRSRLRRPVIFLCFALAAVVVLLLLMDIPASKRIKSISLADSTTAARLLLWSIAWQGFIARPLHGWGIDNFDLVFDRFYSPTMFTLEPWYDSTHNILLEWLISGGLPALCLGVALLVALVLAFARTRRLNPQGRGVMLGLIAAYVFYSFFALNDLQGSIYFVLMVAFAQTLTRGSRPEPVQARIISSRMLKLATPLLAIFAAVGAYAINAPGISNAIGLLQASTVSTSDGVGGKPATLNLAEFKRVLATAVLGRQEATQQLLEFAFWVATRPGPQPDSLTARSAYEAAHNAMTQMLRERSLDARLEFSFGVFLNRFRQHEEAAVHLSKAAMLAPKRQNILLELSICHLRMRNYEAALSVLRRAFEIEQRNPDARVSFALALYLTGQERQADGLLAEAIMSALPENPAMSAENYRQVLDNLRTRVAPDAGDEKTRYAFDGLRKRIVELYSTRLTSP
jgi:O-antigen ligase